MRVCLQFIGNLKKSGILRTVAQIPKEDNTFEYAQEVYDEGIVFGTIYLEHEVIDDFGNVIGHFGVSFDNKILAYNLKKEKQSDLIIREAVIYGNETGCRKKMCKACKNVSSKKCNSKKSG